jgi:hypothetical protein
MPAKVQTMAYYGDVPWHDLRTRVPMGVSAEQMIRAAGLESAPGHHMESKTPYVSVDFRYSWPEANFNLMPIG